MWTWLAVLLFHLSLPTTAYPGITQQPLSTNDPYYLHVATQIPSIKTPSKYWGSIQRPYPTNSWYSNLGLGSSPVTAFPYILRPVPDALGAGISICQPALALTYNHLTYFSAQTDDLLLYLAGPGPRRIESSSLLGLTTLWPAPAPALSPSLRVPWVQGSPFVTAWASGGAFNISTGLQLATINSMGPVEGQVFGGNKFEMILKDEVSGNGKICVLWVLNGEVKMRFFGGARDGHPVLVGTSSLLPEEETAFRIACVANHSTIAQLEPFLPNIVIGGDVTIPEDITTNQVPITFTWDIVDESRNPVNTEDVLMLGLPHHDASIDKSKLKEFDLLPGVWKVTKGPMLGYVGSQWTLNEDLSDAGWFSKQQIDPSKIDVLRSALITESKNLMPSDTDVYNFGKYVGALARLVLIAEQMGETDIQNSLLNQLKTQLMPWLTNITSPTTFLYDETWGSTVSSNGWQDSGLDFGNGIFNDHHYQNGYYIYATAVVLKYDPTWMYGAYALDLIRDIANPSSKDTYFPITRHKDWYSGHSYASGLQQDIDGKNQESTSEAINAYYAIMLYGQATNNNFIRNLGRVLLATEIRSTHQYYHIMPGSTIYPPAFANNTIVGILWSDKAEYTTFFGNNPAYIHCIQMLPFTPITEELLTKSFVEVEYPVLAPSLGSPVSDDWRALILLDWAIISTQEAWNAISTYPDAAFLTGNTRTNSYYWIATRPTN